MDTTNILVMIGSLVIGAAVRHFFAGINKKEAHLQKHHESDWVEMRKWQREQDEKLEALNEKIHAVEKQQLINKAAAAEASSHYKQCVNYKLKHNG